MGSKGELCDRINCKEDVEPLIQEPNDPSGAYAAFFFTEDEAIDHCRKINRELKPGDSNCYAVIDGPGCGDDEDEHPQDCQCCAYAVVDLETAKEILDYPESGLPCVMVTD